MSGDGGHIYRECSLCHRVHGGPCWSGQLPPNTVLTVDSSKQAPIDVPSIMRASGYGEGVKAEREHAVNLMQRAALVLLRRINYADVAQPEEPFSFRWWAALVSGPKAK
jgi:hypothetical protein